MFIAEKITNTFAKVYHEKVVPRTQQEAIENCAKQNHDDLEEKCQAAYANHSNIEKPVWYSMRSKMTNLNILDKIELQTE